MGAAALAPLCALAAARGARGAEFREVTFCAQVAYLGAICLRPFSTPSHPKLHLGAQGAPNGPTESQGSQRKTKVTARRAPWEPKAPQRLSKRSPKSPQGEQNEFRRRSNEFNKSQNYIHINKIYANSRSTAIQRPTSIYSARSQHIQQKPKALIVSYPKRLFLQNGRHVSKTNKSCAGLVQ